MDVNTKYLNLILDWEIFENIRRHESLGMFSKKHN